MSARVLVNTGNTLIQAANNEEGGWTDGSTSHGSPEEYGPWPSV